MMTCQRQCCKIDALDKNHNLLIIHRSHLENLFDCEKLDLYVKVSMSVFQNVSMSVFMILFLVKRNFFFSIIAKGQNQLLRAKSFLKVHKNVMKRYPGCLNS